MTGLASATLFRVTGDAGVAARCPEWTRAGTGNLRVLPVAPARLAAPYLAGLAEGDPYALLAGPDGVDAALDLVSAMTAAYPAVALFLAGTAPDDTRDYPPHPVPVVGLAGRHDVTAPPGAMAGWIRRFGRRFRLIMFEGGTDFLETETDAVVAVIETELWIRPIDVPALADWPGAQRSLAAMRA